MQRLPALTVLILMLCAWCAAAFARPAAARMQQPEGGVTLPGTLVFDSSESEPKFSKFAGYDQDKGKVTFGHDAHAGYAGVTCAVCHHTNATTLSVKDGKASEFVMRCTNCHTDQPMAPSPFEGTRETRTFKGKPAVEVKFAFMGPETSTHPDRLAGCIACHREMGRSNPKAARIVTCNTCHVP